MKAKKKTKPSWFTKFAKAIAKYAGNPITFLSAAALILIWAVTGQFFNYNDTWQLVINTSTTIITFLMVFIIQNTQNRDTAALHIKLDELIKVLKGTNEQLLDLEELEEKDIEDIRKEYETIAKKARTKLKT